MQSDSCYTQTDFDLLASYSYIVIPTVVSFLCSYVYSVPMQSYYISIDIQNSVAK